MIRSTGKRKTYQALVANNVVCPYPVVAVISVEVFAVKLVVAARHVCV